MRAAVIKFDRQEDIYSVCVRFRNILFSLIDHERLPVKIAIDLEEYDENTRRKILSSLRERAS